MKKIIFILGIALLLSISLVSAHEHEMMGGYNPFGFGWFGMGFGFIFMLLFWGFIIWLIVWIIKNSTKPQTGKSESAIEILKKRYAKGEVNKKQFEEMKKELLKK